jgi:hypothetical protein
MDMRQRPQYVQDCSPHEISALGLKEVANLLFHLHSVPSTSKTIPFSFGNEVVLADNFSGSSGAKRRRPSGFDTPAIVFAVVLAYTTEEFCKDLHANKVEG